MKISIIIPVFNEAGVIGRTVKEIGKRAADSIHEIIVVDGNSSDSTRKEAVGSGATTVIRSPGRGRAVQMNRGAGHASGEILLFLHADTIPPYEFDRSIKRAVSEGWEAGCFRLGFDENHHLLKTYAWFTRFDLNAFRFGDQGLFILHTAFNKIGGYREDHLVMEDNEIVRRIKRSYSFKILSRRAITSGRKYRHYGYVKLQLLFCLIYTLYMLGTSQEKLIRIYHKFLRNRE